MATTQVTQYGRLRDSQRSRLYGAEEVLAKRSKALPGVADLQGYVDQMVGTEWWRRTFPAVRAVQVRDGRGRTHPAAAGRAVLMPRFARSEFLLLHEVAHVVTNAQAGGARVALHGPEYARNYLLLVERFMGEVAARALRESFRADGIKVKRLSAAEKQADGLRREIAELRRQLTLKETELRAVLAHRRA